MKNIIIILITISFGSCNTDLVNEQKTRIDSLSNQLYVVKNENYNIKQENEKLQRWVKSYQEDIKPRKYAYVLITYSGSEIRLGYRSEPYRAEINKFVWSPIKEFDNFDDNKKYMFMDDVERELRNSYDFKNVDERKINSVDCFSFDSYSDASKDLATRK